MRATMRMAGYLAWLGAVAAALPVRAAPPPAAVLRSVDDVYLGKTSQGVMEMEVATPDWKRTMRMRFWSRGRDVFLVRVEAPEKDRGISTLRNGSQIWNYLPRIDRTVKVPASMLAEAWMGSDLANDDLVKLSSLAEDYEGRITFEGQRGGERELEVTALPRPDAPVVWSKVVVTALADDLLPLRAAYYAEDGALARTLVFSDVRELGGRRLPARITVEPAAKPGHRTTLRYLEIAFDRPIPDARFSLHALRGE